MKESSVQDCGLQDYLILVSDIYSWGNLKGKVYTINAHAAEALQK
jgi:hypothetical protein